MWVLSLFSIFITKYYIMANIPIYPGSSSFFPGNTPFGFYDYDYQFQTDADKVTRFCALRLGYPIENVELQDLNFYAAFEEAVTVYGNEVYAYQLRDNYLSLEGSPTSSALNNTLVTPNLGPIVRLSQQYAEEAGTGGNVTWYSGSVTLTSSVQDYDLGDWATQNNITGGIEVKRVFYEGTPAINELYSPWSGLGPGTTAAVGLLGLAGYGPSTNFVLMPLSYDMANINAIEMSNNVRYSNYTFQLINNKLRIFPIPGGNDSGLQFWFNYIKVEERLNSSLTPAPGKITNVSNTPYNNPNYSQINAIGRSWIFEYTLALCKEMLGYIRGKYSSIPIPGAEVTLNQGDLITAATNEKEALITRIREYFDTTSKQSLLERRAAESTARQTELNQVPMTIYIG
jgi:hypothetical protein